MINKKLTQTGLNRVIWHLLRERQDGKFTIHERDIEQPNPEEAIKINYDSSSKSFILSAHKIRADRKEVSSIILPSGVMN